MSHVFDDQITTLNFSGRFSIQKSYKGRNSTAIQIGWLYPVRYALL
jgi:hypothetical protein